MCKQIDVYRCSSTAYFDPGIFSLLPGRHRFSLDKDTGLIMLIARLDYELIQRFTLTVIARDGGGEETTGRVRINVLDVNDNVPTFQKDAYVGALRENEPSVTQLVRLRVRPGSPAFAISFSEFCQEMLNAHLHVWGSSEHRLLPLETEKGHIQSVYLNSDVRPFSIKTSSCSYKAKEWVG